MQFIIIGNHPKHDFVEKITFFFALFVFFPFIYVFLSILFTYFIDISLKHIKNFASLNFAIVKSFNLIWWISKWITHLKIGQNAQIFCISYSLYSRYHDTVVISLLIFILVFSISIILSLILSLKDTHTSYLFFFCREDGSDILSSVAATDVK